MARAVNETNPDHAEGVGSHAASEMIASTGSSKWLDDSRKDKGTLSLECVQQEGATNVCVACYSEGTSLFRGLKEARHN